MMGLRLPMRGTIGISLVPKLCLGTEAIEAPLHHCEESRAFRRMRPSGAWAQETLNACEQNTFSHS
jgi:hypothetical protein